MNQLASTPTGRNSNEVPAADNGASNGERELNTTQATIEQIIYHGFATHLHLRMPNGEPLIAFEQNRASGVQPAIRPDMQAYPRWNTESGQFVRDEAD